MAQITVIDRSGNEEALELRSGITLMQTISDAGNGELMALCGGVCSCATCHVYVDDSHWDKLPPLSPDENDLLEGSMHRRENSRLSCQITLSVELGGLRATIAPED